MVAYITINKNGTARYEGDMMQSNGKFKKVSLTGNWETEADSIMMSEFDTNRYSGVYFKWSDGTNEGFAIGNSMFGDQWHSFNWVSE